MGVDSRAKIFETHEERLDRLKKESLLSGGRTLDEMLSECCMECAKASGKAFTESVDGAKLAGRLSLEEGESVLLAHKSTLLGVVTEYFISNKAIYMLSKNLHNRVGLEELGPYDDIYWNGNVLYSNGVAVANSINDGADAKMALTVLLQEIYILIHEIYNK